MADDISASVITLHQPRPKKAKTGAERARAYRERKKGGGAALSSLPVPAVTPVAPSEAPSTPTDRKGAISKIPPTGTVTPIPPPTVTLRDVARDEHAPSLSISRVLLLAAALALASVGIAMNGWFARSLGSSDIAGWLFLAIGVAADLIALVMPSCAARLWRGRQRAISLAGWTMWAMTFVFAVTAGIGFASTNIADVTLARASRVTPAVAMAQAALSDAMTARDRECRGGVGKFCREREAAVIERRRALDTATQAVGQTADPQTDAASRIVAWATQGALQPTGNDFAMLRLVLLALLPQIGGILLMVSRSEMEGVEKSTAVTAERKRDTLVRVEKPEECQ